jgi:hypothetical protein
MKLDNELDLTEIASIKNVESDNILEMGGRVIATFENKNKTQSKSNNKNDKYLCSATIAEIPSSKNKNRYLVFFDNGYVSYVDVSSIFMIYDQLTIPVERIHFDHLYFLKNYFKNYPNIDMINDFNDNECIYFNNEWRMCHVLQKDCSLLRIEYPDENEDTLRLDSSTDSNENKSSFWLYAGSFRLKQIHDNIISRINEPKSELEKYVREKFDNVLKNYHHFYLHKLSSTSFPKIDRNSKLTSIQIAQTIKNKIKISFFFLKTDMKTIIGYKQLRNDSSEQKCKLENVKPMLRKGIINYKSHSCGHKCVMKWEEESKLFRHFNPLLAPMINGWQRQMAMQSRSSKKWVNYVTPCGVMLRNISEVENYLQITNSKLTIDTFTFDSMIHTGNTSLIVKF